MSDNSSRSTTRLGIESLPNELFSLIIESFVAGSRIIAVRDFPHTSKPVLHPISTRELLSLRLVCKNWSTAITPFAFHTISLKKPSSLKSLLQNCGNLIDDPNYTCPVKRLRIDHLWYSKLYDANNWSEELELFDDGNDFEEDSEEELWKAEVRDPHFSPIFMDQAAKVIEFFGHNLLELHLSFCCSVGFLPCMLKSVEHINCLEKLTLEIGHQTYDSLDIDNDPESLSKLLNATLNLKSLVLYYDDLTLWELKPRALSKLQHLWFKSSNRNVIGISYLFGLESLKVVQFDYVIGPPQLQLAMAITSIQNTLEGLFTTHIPYCIPTSIIGLSFPQLRVIRALSWKDPSSYPYWLQWPIFQAIRTVVASITHGGEYWKTVLKCTGKGCLQKPNNLKHFIFTTHRYGGSQEEESLADAFKLHDIECHFVPELDFGGFLVRMMLIYISRVRSRFKIPMTFV
ncbi:uncharacterized protein MELLADRAFT_59124 [Melampsora larici-populina 98AG31]|uniref:F-box domain-containing protein n=1 Tax=Melampsora larici-populina (strain 98AG31 / pathotype 3-4-7) TaxID=747676 RepID=F4R539_MELLP|nr:uncharacterized protein MELLADRAFT_59124 [Melampsora larici-populina 98AG31]EGG12337.1 hypothetical protein MELLADRAFT_59124 [Melampsora larici-populina 98AG31]